MPYRDAILAALERSGRSARGVSLAAVKHDSAIKNLKRGADLRGSTIEALCRELGLSLSIGPPPSPAQAAGAFPPPSLPELERHTRGLVRVVAEAGGEPVPDDLWPVLAARRGRPAEADGGG